MSEKKLVTTSIFLASSLGVMMVCLILISASINIGEKTNHPKNVNQSKSIAHHPKTSDQEVGKPKETKRKEEVVVKPQVKEDKPILPIEGKTSGEFGWRKEKGKDFEEWFYVPALDFEISGTKAIKAVLSGKVEGVEQRNGPGKTIVISHKNGWKSSYVGCFNCQVKKGDEVIQGQIIAEGKKKLQYRLTKNNHAVNPKEYFLNHHL